MSRSLSEEKDRGRTKVKLLSQKIMRNQENDGVRKNIYRRAAIAYLALFGLPGVILAFSWAKGAGWKPVLAGLPVMLTIFASITYQFVKELRAVRSKEGKEPRWQDTTSDQKRG